MDDAYIDFYYFFCPNRILWDNFKYFMGEVETQPWMPTKTYKVPEIIINAQKEGKAPYEESILDYMGVPTKIIETGSEAKIEINALPVRAYTKIWNEFFRDQNVGNQATFLTDDEDVTYKDSEATAEEILEKAHNGGRCLPVNRFHDYFSSCLPYPQRGPETTIALTGNAPVKMYDDAQMTDPYFGSIYLGNDLGKLEASATDATEVGGKDVFGEGIPYKYMGADLQNIEATTINQLRQALRFSTIMKH